MFSRTTMFFATTALLAGCAQEFNLIPQDDPFAWELEPQLEIPFDFEYGKPLLDVVPEGYRSYGYDVEGPESGSMTSSAEVWEANQRWYEVTTEAGPAWPENSGLTWDQKYSAWVDAMEKTESEDGWDTIELITPWGKKLPGPAVECAEMSMFLRGTFAVWYELPFFMTAWHSSLGQIHYGHFGIVDGDGTRVTGTPTYTTSYEDYTDDYANQTDEWIVQNWPSDTDLAAKSLTTAKDDQVEFLGDDAYAGAYFDEIHLNKRAGHFLLKLLTNFGSMHVASAKNTFNLKPESILEGDVLIHRWQSQGIGHVMVVKTVEDLGNDHLDAEITYGSMPRIQPKWYDGNISKSYFTSNYAGSGEMSGEGVAYSHFGGGIKRWRTPVDKNGYWTNIVPVVNQDSWIGSTDYDAIEERIDTFKMLLGDLTPAEELDVLVERIDMARHSLSEHPSSCTNRQRREEAFTELYALTSEHYGLDKAATDAKYRKLEDYIFAELVYDQSKTCCWNSTTNEMYDIIIDYNTELVTDAANNGQCLEPVVFKAEDGGYKTFSDYATANGQGDQWVAWNDDETCPQATVLDDTEETHDWTGFCDVAEDLLGIDIDGSDNVDPCDGLNWPGECDGDTVRWCQNGQIQEYECDNTCDWVDYYGYYWCI
ncbi:MAG: hypothetical protein HN348_03410 [Proteobacteria bacterium]|nr:hypothetical protein [Pseudomonadota bacterium]